MKSLRLRLTFKLGAAFVLIWALAAAWMLNDLRNQMMFSLDQRLVASARMVAGLTEQMPGLASVSGGAHFSAEQLHVPGGMACQVSSLRGEILARSHTTPEEGLESRKSGFRDQVVDGVGWRSFTLSRGDLLITTADRQVEREALNLSILLAASVPVGVAMLGCLCLLWLGIGQSLLPLNRMRDALMRRSADSLEPLQIHPLPSELKPLLDTQNQLLQRIAKTIERERRLTGDAAHELRTPLAALQAQVGQHRDVGVGNMPAILAQMGRDAVGAGRQGQLGGAHRLGIAGAARVPDRRHVVDIDAQSDAHLMLARNGMTSNHSRAGSAAYTIAFAGRGGDLKSSATPLPCRPMEIDMDTDPSPAQALGKDESVAGEET